MYRASEVLNNLSDMNDDWVVELSSPMRANKVQIDWTAILRFNRKAAYFSRSSRIRDGLATSPSQYSNGFKCLAVAFALHYDKMFGQDQRCGKQIGHGRRIE
jgi:hypothetical protein